MGLFGGGKSSEEKIQERIAKALDSMGISAESVGAPDGKVHVGCFEAGSVMNSYANMSLVIDGAIGFLQQNGREIIDVKVSPCGSSDSFMSQLVTVMYR